MTTTATPTQVLKTALDAMKATPPNTAAGALRTIKQAITGYDLPTLSAARRELQGSADDYKGSDAFTNVVIGVELAVDQAAQDEYKGATLDHIITSAERDAPNEMTADYRRRMGEPEAVVIAARRSHAAVEVLEERLSDKLGELVWMDAADAQLDKHEGWAAYVAFVTAQAHQHLTATEKDA